MIHILANPSKVCISENVFLVAEDAEAQPIGFVDMGVCGAVLYLHELYVLPVV